MKARTVAAAVGGIAAAYAAERVLVGRPRARTDLGAVAAFGPPEDGVHHDVPLSDGGSLHVVEVGAGRPLVLLHGITLSSLAWHDQLRDLSDRFRVIAVDHRGHGSSKAGDGPWDLARLARDVRELFEGLDLADAVLVGHSMGGMVALQYALDHPDALRRHVAGLVLMSTSSTPVHRLAGWEALTKAVTPALKRGLALGERVPGGLFARSDLSYLVFRFGMGKGATPEHVELNRMMTAATPLSVLGELFSGVAGFDVRDRLHEIDLPALVLVGTRDLLTPPSAARTMVAGLRRARPLVAYPGAGHMLMLERRHEVNQAIAAFAEELS
ncbi:MAG TPA: alpha/beta hydrolase [Acidimicrobiales bacterium]|nr:alpha/beta hydrolase [Acidimicrobiales bacterium]